MARSRTSLRDSGMTERGAGMTTRCLLVQKRNCNLLAFSLKLLQQNLSENHTTLFSVFFVDSTIFRAYKGRPPTIYCGFRKRAWLSTFWKISEKKVGGIDIFYLNFLKLFSNDDF